MSPRPAVRTYTEQRLAAGAAPASINRELAVLKRALSNPYRVLSSASIGT